MKTPMRMLVIAAAVCGLGAVSRAELAPSALATPISPVAVAPMALPDFSALVQAQGPSVVNITATFAPSADPARDALGEPGATRMATGSGFIFRRDGYVLTNAHVVAGARQVSVKLPDRRQFNAQIVGVDRRTDIAVLRIDAHDLPAARLGDPAQLRVGQWVAAIGSPFGFENSLSAGIVSAKGRALPEQALVPFIQTDVAVNPGNSGGPLFELGGTVVGINSQIYSHNGGYMGLSFAIPIDIAAGVANQLIDSGHVTHGRLGANIQELDATLAGSFGMAKPEGALVSGLEPGGAAERAGLRAGDVILSVNGQPVGAAGDLPPLVGALHGGASVRLRIWRAGAERAVVATLGELPPDAGPPVAHRAAPRSGPLGLALSELPASLRQRLNLESGLRVEAATGAAARAGIGRGDIVLSVNGKPVAHASEFEKLLHAAAGHPLALLIQRGDTRQFIPVLPG